MRQYIQYLHYNLPYHGNVCVPLKHITQIDMHYSYVVFIVDIPLILVTMVEGHMQIPRNDNQLQ